MTQDAVKELDAMKGALTALQPLEAEGRARALHWLAQTLGVDTSFVGSIKSTKQEEMNDDSDTGDTGTVGAITPKQFMANKKPLTDVERIACLAYYLTYGRDTIHFKTEDITALNTEAAGLRFGNASQAATNAMNQNGFIAQAGQGKKQLTPRGEALVEALPDREAVAAALAEFPKRARRASRRKSAAKKT